MTKTKIIIELESENSAAYLKAEILKFFPLLEGRIATYKEPEIKPLSECIADLKRK